MSLLLRHHGLELSEAMVFGLSGALMFAYIPFVKLGGLPLIAYRSMPRAIIKGLRKNLGIGMKMVNFSNPSLGKKALDEVLDAHQVVGAQTSVFWLPYFPEEMRFHFNAHNLIIFGRDNNDYLISDPVFEHPMRCPSNDLQKARFVKGMMAPKGLLYYPEKIPEQLDYAKIIPKVIRKNARAMLKTPVPVAGLGAMRLLARHLGRLDKPGWLTQLRQRPQTMKISDCGVARSQRPQYPDNSRYARLFMGHIVRMQEEIGTGGAGFRFIYASFLQEAGELLGCDALLQTSQQLTLVGDQWREFALMLVKAIRIKDDRAVDFAALRRKLESIAEAEAEVYRDLLKLTRNNKIS